MKTIYSKISNNRKKDFQIETKFIKGNNESLFVVKKGLYSNKHIENMYQSYLALKDIYNVSPLYKYEDGIKYNFVKGKSLEQLFLDGNYKETLLSYKKILENKNNESLFVSSNEFIGLFGNIDIPSNTICSKLSNIDLLLSNIIDNNGKFEIIDIEWVFNFTVPIDFIAYRALKELYRNKSIKLDYKEAINILNIKMDVEILELMCQKFDEYVLDRNYLDNYKKEDRYIFSAIDDANKEINRLNNRIDELGEWGSNIYKEVEDRNIHISKLDEQIKENNDMIDELSNEVNQRNAHIIKLDNEIKEKNSAIDELSVEVKERNVHITKLDNEIIEQGKTIESLNVEVLNRGNHIKKLDNEIAIKDSIIVKNNETIDIQQQEISKQNNIISNQNEVISNQEANIDALNTEVFNRGEHILHLDKEIASKDESIVSLNKEVENRGNHIRKLDIEIEDLRRQSEELRQIKDGNFYKLSMKYYKVRDFFFPMGSKRKTFVKLVGRAIRHPIWFIKHLSPTNVKKFVKYSRSEGFTRACERTEVYQLNNTELEYAKRLDLENMNVREEYSTLIFKPEDKPLVSIVIPVYNQFSYTYGCLATILRNTNDVSYEVIVGDDCSTDETSHLEDYAKNILIVKTKENARFLRNCNNAAKYAKGKYIYFLNNDTNVQPRWLSSLVETIESNDNIGLVGSKLVYPNGMLQEAGGILWKDGSAWNFGYKSDPDASEYNYRKSVDYISGAAIMIKTSLWKKIGGFDELFAPAYCEDSDLCFEVRKQGFDTVYDPFSVVVHYEGVSNGTDVTQGLKKYQVENTVKFYEKWKDVLASHYPNAENVFIARDRTYNKKTLLMIDHYVPQYDRDAGSRTVFGYLKLFVALGYNVKFIGENFYRHEPYTTELQKMGVEVLYGPYYANNYKEWLTQNGKYIDLVFFNRPHITTKFIDDVKDSCNKAKFIYYGHDLHYVRCMKEYELKGDKKVLEESNKWKEIEFDIFKKVDLILYPSIVEKELLLKEDSSLNVEVLQPYLYDNKEYKTYNFKDREGIMFIGGFRHGPNFDGIMWFVKEIYPSILKENKNMKLYIAGSYPPEELCAMANDNIIVKGFVSDEELAKLYNSTRMVVVPLRYGAGIKGKVVEAMEFNVPVITTNCGAEGIITDAVVVDESLLKINDLYDNKKALMELSKKEYDFIESEYTMDSAKEKMVEMLNKLK